MTMDRVNQAMRICLDNPHLLRYYLKEGADVNHIKDNDKYTPLMYAVMLGSEHAISILLEYGASVNLLDYVGRTALDHTFRCCSDYEPSLLLMKHGGIPGKACWHIFSKSVHDFYYHHKSLEVLVRVLPKDIVRVFKSWLLI